MSQEPRVMSQEPLAINHRLIDRLIAMGSYRLLLNEAVELLSYSTICHIFRTTIISYFQDLGIGTKRTPTYAFSILRLRPRILNPVMLL